MDERKKILIHRIIWLSILLIFIFLPTIVLNCQPELKLISSECYTSSNEYSSECEIELKFNRKVENGKISIAFYDVDDNLIDIHHIYFDEEGKTITETEYVYGVVGSYEIISHNFETPFEYVELMFYFIPLVAIIFVITLLLNYKEYEFNGKTISVYAGVNKHYLKIDGEKYDEHNSILIFTPIKLSTKFEEISVEATISLTNSITLKINDKLQQPKKTK